MFAGTLASAQDDRARNSNSQSKEGEKYSAVGIISPQENDARIARWLIVDQEVIVGASKMAQERATNDNVKQFAQMMVTEHSSSLDKLNNIKKNHTSTTDSDNRHNPIIGRTDNTTVDPKNAGILVKDPEAKQRDGKMMYHPTDFVKVKEEVCKDIKDKLAKEMKNISGSEFDRAYMMHMLAGHEAMLASCKAVRSTASKDLQAMLDQNIEKLNSHIKQAQQLCDQISGKTTSGRLDTRDNSKRGR